MSSFTRHTKARDDDDDEREKVALLEASRPITARAPLREGVRARAVVCVRGPRERQKHLQRKFFFLGHRQKKGLAALSKAPERRKSSTHLTRRGRRSEESTDAHASHVRKSHGWRVDDVVGDCPAVDGARRGWRAAAWTNRDDDDGEEQQRERGEHRPQRRRRGRIRLSVAVVDAVRGSHRRG